jgi:hypothetical protein
VTLAALSAPRKYAVLHYLDLSSSVRLLSPDAIESVQRLYKKSWLLKSTLAFHSRSSRGQTTLRPFPFNN